MIAPVAIFGIGNRSRGDDAVGPLLLDRLRRWLESRGLAGGFDLFEEYQLQVENALDLEGRELALFIDARLDGGRPVTLEPVAGLDEAAAGSSHSLPPGAVLNVYRRVTGRTSPPAFALGVRAERFELGEGPSDVARDAMEKAWELLESLAGDPRTQSWRARVSTIR
ncbi:MAG: hydrogenase maturation protease [Betaproteobacteria bacterium]|nr:hydrogenase maturation protease [Betaproteobacteria bacterium]